MRNKIICGILAWSCVGFYDGYQCYNRSKQPKKECIENGIAMFFAYTIFFPMYLPLKIIDIEKYFKKKK